MSYLTDLGVATPWTTDRIRTVSERLETAAPQEILEWGIAEFFPSITLACSFGGVSGMVLLDMAMKIEPRIKVFYLDTDYLFPETYALRDKAAAKYNFQPTGYRSLLTPEQQAARHGPALWTSDPDRCCEIRKVEPNVRAMAGQRAWITGLRRDQLDSRKDVQVVEWDEKFKRVKLSPLASWTEKQVWTYLYQNDVPYNELHDRGYPSIGCTNCTKPVNPGDDPRAGRWVGFTKEECGLHTDGEAPLIEVQVNNITKQATDNAGNWPAP